MSSDPRRWRKPPSWPMPGWCKTLLDAGARPDIPNQDGETALMLAIKTGELPVVEMLIKAGANVNARETFHNQTALMWAAAAPKNGGEMVKLLLSKDADFRPRALYSDWGSQITSEPRAQYRPVGGLTALLYAARGGCYECVEALIGAGADVNVPTPEGVTPLMIALDNDHNDVAKLLLDRGANPNLWDWWGRTPLYIAIDRREAVIAPLRTGILTDRAHRAAPLKSRASGRPPVSNLEIDQCPDRCRCRSQSAAQYASPQPGREQRTFRRGVLQYRMHAFAARHYRQRCGSGASASRQGRFPQHQRDGSHTVPDCGGRRNRWRRNRAGRHRPALVARRTWRSWTCSSHTART